MNPISIQAMTVVTPDLLENFSEATFIPNFVLNDVIPKRPQKRTRSPTLVYRPVGHPGKNHQEFSELATFFKDDRRIQFVIEAGNPGSVPNSTVLQRMSEAEFVWDHLNGYYGVTSIEAWACGAIALGAVSWECRNKIFEFWSQFPHWNDVSPSGSSLPFRGKSLQDIRVYLTRLCSNPDLLKDERVACHRFWRDIWQSRYIVDAYHDVYQKAING